MSQRAGLWVLLVALAIGACTPPPPAPTPAERYAKWHRTRAGAADAYLGYLRTHGVADVLPPQQLLRSARRWRGCADEEFAVPPQSQWPAIVPTLRLVRELHGAGLLDRASVGSGYRNPALNRCEGGAPGSKHLSNAALDFDLAHEDGLHQQLCAYWRTHGAARRFGLGFYDSGAIHIDTAGHRTWGYDYTRRSSVCVPPPKPSRIGESKPHRRG
ncbi:D-Ala-D-Ala carboxypeptidase family metallohydrolase [Lysobacter sp. Root983]|uniref:D-Ala-D-Ala carboxypeptidase family metallohydrolase n=1 Tax=Lysobacter sp. Root983 TaxID=1736613 RepID=UPI00070A7ED0|nr:D-Ala-D-Ala carboxypeptidase family metallohydrolase [Lysobacter sp. Root983]KRD74838.1 hypothetical protein ASE43_16645 [Lysobacter sp. Root983]